MAALQIATFAIVCLSKPTASEVGILIGKLKWDSWIPPNTVKVEQ